MNQSEIIVMLNSGAGVRIREAYGMLDVVVYLPPTFNTTCPVFERHEEINVKMHVLQGMIGGGATQGEFFRGRRCYTTLGLMGVYSGDKRDDLQTLNGQVMM